jgi:hypothetical protein
MLEERESVNMKVSSVMIQTRRLMWIDIGCSVISQYLECMFEILKY